MKAVLFDLDDTLLRTIEARWACHKAVAKKFWDIDLTDADIAQHWGVPMSVLVDRIYGAGSTNQERVDAYVSMTPDFPKDVYEFAVSTVTKLLDRGFEVGVITSARGEFAIDDLKRHEFPIDRFCIVQGEEMHPVHKPDPAVFDPALEILGRKGIGPDEIVYVGDSLVDAAAARGAGFRFVGVSTGLPSADELSEAGADVVISDIGDLLEVIE